VLDVSHIATVDVRPFGNLTEGEPGTLTQPAQLRCELSPLVAVQVSPRVVYHVSSCYADTERVAPVPLWRDGSPVADDQLRSVTNRRVINASCTQHGGSRGFTNLVVTKCDGDIELDPHAVGGCVILLDESGARVLSEALQEWLG
jgi:hypothetical protein